MSARRALRCVVTAAVAALTVTLLAPTDAQAVTPGWLDSTYAGGFPQGLENLAVAATVDDSGRALVTYQSTGTGIWGVARLTVDGGVDAGFGTGGKVSLPAGPSYSQMLVGSDGIYVAGPPAAGNGVAIARLTATGVVDGSYGSSGLARAAIPVAIDDVVDLAQLDSGDLVVAAAHTAAPRHDYLTAVTPLGSLDPAWNATGPTPGVLAVADQLAGVTRTANAAVVAGIATGGVTKVRRYAANGTPDASFGSSGVLTLPAPFYAHGIDVGAADGKYYVAGSSGSAPGAPLSVARVLPSGGMLDPAFASSGVATVPVRGVGVVTAAAGSFVYVFGPSFIARLTSVGLVDLTFGTGGALSGFPWPNTFSTFVVSGGVQPSGKAVVVLAFADAADNFPGSGAERVNVASTLPPAPGSFVPLAPVRVLDTRTGTGAPKVAVGAAGSLSLPVGVGASAVVLTVTAVAPTRSGFVTVYPSGTARPTASNLNHPAGATTPNLVTVPVGSDGKVVLYNGSSGTVHLLADVLGFYVTGTPSLPGAFAGLPPARILDTRNGTGAPLAQVPAGGTLTLNVAGRGGVPSSGVSGVVLNATVVGQTKSGYLTLYPAGSTRPVVSNLNFYPGTPRANLATVRLGLGGALSLYNASTAPVDLVADVAGYYLDGTPTAPGMFVAVDPIRILDTRIPSPHPIASHRTLVVPVPSIPAHAAMVMNATSTSASQPGFATFRGASRNPFDTSTLNFVAGQTTASLTVTAGAAFLVYNGSTGTIHAIADLAGYFLP